MIRKKVWRYYCEFCKKAGCSGGHIKKHESRCTKNPNRTCGMCNVMDKDGEQPDLQKAIALLPNPKEYESIDEFGFISYAGLEEAVNEILSQLREIVANCPACIMAALRQKGIPVPLVTKFNFKNECAIAWSDFNSAQEAAYYY